jgi:hypothetical protein
MTPFDQLLYWSFRRGSLVTARLPCLFPGTGLGLSTIEGLPAVEIEGWAAGDGGRAGADALTAALSGAVCLGIKANVAEPRHATNFQLANFDQA